MTISPKLLGAGEHVVIETRTHGKVLVWPAIAIILLAAAVGVGVALLSGSALPASVLPWAQLATVIAGVILAVWWSVAPFLRWLSTTYTVTNRRLITRTGVFRRVGKDMPLMRINDVSYERSLLDRMLGCGTLNIQTAAEGGTIVLRDVPDVEQVHLTMTEMLFGAEEAGRRNDERGRGDGT